MMVAAKDIYRFDLGHVQYQRVRLLGWLFLSLMAVCVVAGILCGSLLWRTYTHQFTFSLKWQDALVLLAWFVSLTAVGGGILVARFLCALHAGRWHGMITFEDEQTVTVRDLSAENLKSIFWIMNSAFWCFLVALVGLAPLILVGWTLQLETPWLMCVATALTGMLSLVGMAVSVVAITFIAIGWIGGVSFCRKLGSSHTYQLNGQTAIRIDNFVLTVIYPGHPESMVDLNLLSAEDQKRLLALLHKRWMAAERVWNPTLGDEIAQALEEAALQLAPL